MKKIIAIFIAIGILTSESFSQENVKGSECDSLVAEAKKQFGCGQAFWLRSSLLKQAADCYAKNNEIDKAIKFTESKIVHVNEQNLLSIGWAEKLIEYQRARFGDRFVQSHLNGARVKTEIMIDEFSLLFADTAASTSIGATVELFGKEYRILSTIESQEKDKQIRNDFISKKISKKELNEYFEKRWNESLLYKEIEKIK